MKVIIATKSVFHLHNYGGEPKYIYYLNKYLVEMGVDVEIIAPLNRTKKRMEIYEGIKYVFIPPMIDRRISAIWHLLFSTNLAIHLRKKEFDILHSYEMIPYTYLHFKNRAPTIIQPFGLEPFTNLSHLKAIEENVVKRIYVRHFLQHPWKYCITHADAVAIEGDFQTEQMERLFGVNKEKLFNLPVGVDISSIKERLEEKKVLRKDLGLNDDDFVLISVNRFDSDKGVNYLVDAFNIIKQNLNNAKLILVGTGHEEERIMNQVRNCKLNKDVIHLKNVPEDLLYYYYGLSDLYISPTLQDDFMMGILEAMVCGLPIVSTGQDFLVRSGANGFVVPKRDPQAIADAVLRIYDGDKYKVMGNVSRKMVKDYDMKIIAKTAIVEYEKLCDGNRWR